MVVKKIVWQDIPGYRIILKSILFEMKEREVSTYPDALIDSTVSLLANEKLLNSFVSIVFKKTNAYDTLSVVATLELVNKWF